MHKDKLEAMCRAAGLTPERRVRVGDFDVLVADGLSRPPHQFWRRFGINADEFPGGCYATLWLVAKDERLDIAAPIFFELLHDPLLSSGMKKTARVNTAIREAAGFIQRRKAAHARLN